jgi:hypothetical protein
MENENERNCIPTLQECSQSPGRYLFITRHISETECYDKCSVSHEIQEAAPKNCCWYLSRNGLQKKCFEAFSCPPLPDFDLLTSFDATTSDCAEFCSQ